MATCFNFNNKAPVPSQIAPTLSRNIPNTPIQINPSNDADRLHILLASPNVEDSVSIAKLIDFQTHTVTMTNSPSSVMNMIKTGEKQYDVVIADVDLLDNTNLWKDLEKLGVLILLASAKTSHLKSKGTDGVSFPIHRPGDVSIIQSFNRFVMNRKGKTRSMETERGAVAKYTARQHHEAPGDAGGENHKKIRKNNGNDIHPHRGSSFLLDFGNATCKSIGSNESSAGKKSPRSWTPELHQKFVDVVTQLGVENSSPKVILELMNVPGLDRKEVGSHLQTYRDKIRGTKRNQSRKSVVAKPREKKVVVAKQREKIVHPQSTSVPSFSTQVLINHQIPENIPKNANLTIIQPEKPARDGLIEPGYVMKFPDLRTAEPILEEETDDYLQYLNDL